MSVCIQPDTHDFKFKRLQPDGIASVFPPIEKAQRRRSEDATEPPRRPAQRHLSIDAEPLRPVRKNSRYEFATEGEGEAVLPQGFPELLAYASPTELDAPVPKSKHQTEHLEPIIAPDSPDKWVLDVVDTGRARSDSLAQGRRLFQDGLDDNEIVLVRSRSSTGSQPL